MSKKNVIFDIDNTLVHTIFNDTPHDSYLYKKLKYHKDDELTVFFRPGLEKFLDIVFKKYNVSIWTAGNMEYAKYICELIMKGRKLDFIFSKWHCDRSNSDDTYLNKYGFNPVKNLNYVFDKFDSYNPQNTILVDDLYQTFYPQRNNVIFCEFFNVLMPAPYLDNYLVRLVNLLNEKKTD